jgi:cob(I)alamin adenosyltransferase
MARASARRAERRVVALSQQEEVPTELLAYLNRLSDWLIVAARRVNHEAGVEELFLHIPKTARSVP